MSLSLINPARETIAMFGRHLKWLNDGQSFLEHLSDLSQIRIVARCRTCLVADARPALDGQSPKMLVWCQCHTGAVKTDRPLDVQPLLLALGWNLACSNCGEPVQGDNDRWDSRVTVTCACTTREYRLPVANVVH